MTFQYQQGNFHQGNYAEVETPFSQQSGFTAAAVATSNWNIPSMSYPSDYDNQWFEDDYDYYEDEPDIWQVESFRSVQAVSPHLKMVIIVAAVVCIIILLIISRWIVNTAPQTTVITAVNAVTTGLVNEPTAPLAPVSTSTLSPIFAPAVKHWESKIVEWANTHGLDPNMVATIMQIESCGDPQAVSSAGAQGLFQVMPFHFAAGEIMTDPDTNAYRGMKFLAELMVMFNGDTGLSMAGYNGGPGNAKKSPEFWPSETQRYHKWGTGIYSDAQAGVTVSPNLQRWLDAGGTSLCNQAAQRLGIQ